MRITRKVEFDAGHRVWLHESKCRHLHGHRYVAEVTVEAHKLDSIGRVIDFSVIKEKVKGWIDRNWDHNVLLNEDDPLLSLFAASESHIANNRSPYVMDCNPTAENMAKELFDICCGLLENSSLAVVHVRIYETPNCWADYDGS